MSQKDIAEAIFKVALFRPVSVFLHLDCRVLWKDHLVSLAVLLDGRTVDKSNLKIFSRK